MPQDVLPLSSQWKHHDGVAMPPCPSGDVSLQNMATTLYNAVLHPLAPYALSGVVWYQGESNTGNPAPYADLLKKMIGNWRTLWQEPTLPFCVVQLANYDGRQQTGNPQPITPQTAPVNSNWARLREAQRTVAANDPYTELACIIDLGEKVDIHPLRKKEVAERIGLCFDRQVFGKKIQLSPQPVSAECNTTGEQQGSEVVITFDQPVQGGQAITEMEVADSNGHFMNVDETFSEGNKISLKSPISDPVKVRYAWKDCPQATLRSATGLPVTPFEVKLGEPASR
jgi:sialate O-acetylesterase